MKFRRFVMTMPYNKFLELERARKSIPRNEYIRGKLVEALKYHERP